MASKKASLNRLIIALILLALLPFAKAEDHPPPTIKPFEIPTFTGKPVDWNKHKAVINPLPVIDSDAIFHLINKCYPLKSGFGLEISVRSGVNYQPSSNKSTLQTYDSQNYYAGIVANMPLYSDIEIDKERKLEYQRRMQTTDTIKALLSAVASKRRADRLMGLYSALEKRSQERVRQGIASVEEQIAFLEKSASTQGELDIANATIEASRLALIGQCRPEVEAEVNTYLLQEIDGAKK